MANNFVFYGIIGESKVYTGTDALASLPSFCVDGYTGIVCDNNTEWIACDLASNFRQYSRQYVIVKDANELPTYTRFIIGVGTGKIAHTIKTKAKEMEIECALLFTAPTTDTILEGGGIGHIFLDRAILSKCPRECIASGWGIVLSEGLARFEDYYNLKVLDKGSEMPKFKELQSQTDECALAIRLIEMSAVKMSDDNATVMAKLLYDNAIWQGTKPRMVGEYKFICANVLYSLYLGFLSSPSIDCMLPPDHDKKLDKIASYSGRSRERLIKMFDFFDTKSYFSINYIMSEYRLDLLDKLKTLDFSANCKRWRRLYADAGYWLKSTWTASMLLKALDLSAEIGTGLLRYIDETGYLENFA